MELAEVTGLVCQEHQQIALDFGHSFLPVGEDKFLESACFINFIIDEVKELVKCLFITRNATQVDLDDIFFTDDDMTEKMPRVNISLTSFVTMMTASQ